MIPLATFLTGDLPPLNSTTSRERIWGCDAATNIARNRRVFHFPGVKSFDSSNVKSGPVLRPFLTVALSGDVALSP